VPRKETPARTPTRCSANRACSSTRVDVIKAGDTEGEPCGSTDGTLRRTTPARYITIGRRIVNVVPWPSALSTSMVPPWFSTMP
jgi:hypothetical protein